jgi:hypothetical protein
MEIPRRQLLAACETVLRTRPGVFENARQALSANNPEQIPQLEVLLTKPRSTQLLMDLTLGSDRVIGGQNIEQVMDLMRRTVAEDIQKEADAKVETVKKLAAAEAEAITRMADEYRRKAEGMSLDAAIARAKDVNMVEGWINAACMYERRWIAGQKFAFCLLALFVFLAAGVSLAHLINPIAALVLAIFAAGSTCTVTIMRIFDRYPNVLKPWLEKQRMELFQRRAHEAQREDLLQLFAVDWKGCKVIALANETVPKLMANTVEEVDLFGGSSEQNSGLA